MADQGINTSSLSIEGKKMTDRDPLINRTNPVSEGGFFDGLLRPCLAELVGVTLFVFIGTMSVNGNDTLGIALAHGLAIALLVMSTASISGGHLNPAVTLGVFLSGSIAPLTALLYFISQLLGGILGSALTRGVLSQHTFTNISGGATTLGPTTSAAQGLLCEVVLTSVLVSVVLLAAVDEDTKNLLGPLGIGFAVVVDILAGASVSGASMNPARSFGPAVVVSVYDSDVWSYHYIYWVGPALGSLLAVIWYRLFLAGPHKRLIAVD
ncbi:aquaporin-8 isoform X1 [Aplysia californica]|uniref:Aquaporin-8 isoform X1 n=2 Tax=Aplysia californica TaxID=6500 RepID=A0ABM0ZVW0_APLCA|nr:aquaporin-8 isoform X1 [Aplysia californica]